MVAFVVNGMVNMNNMMLKIYIFVNIEREGFTTTQAGIEHDVDGGAETVVALVNQSPFRVCDCSMRTR